MSTPVFNAKLTVTAVQEIAAPSDWQITIDVLDGEGIFYATDIQPEDILFLDTSLSYPATISRFKVIDILPDVTPNTATVIVTYDDDLDPLYLDLYSLLPEGLVCRPTFYEKFSTTGDSNIQNLPSKFVTYLRDKDFSIIDALFQTGGMGATGPRGETGIQGVTGPAGGGGSGDGSTGLQGVTGIQGATGINGVQGVTGTQGTQGYTGIQGVTGVQGTQGVTGIIGAQGVTGINGQIGTTGIQGVTGIQGAIGQTGAQGLTGARGLHGETGAQGVKGDTGTQGIQGVTGPQGQAADVMRFKGVINSSGAFPAIGTRLNGDFYTVTASVTDAETSQSFVAGDEIVWNEQTSSWVLVGSTITYVQGETGARGVTGVGVQGVTGLAGATGLSINGATGIQGIQGNTGLGVKGETGAQGVTGPGYIGSDGVTGIQGVTGLSGPQGSTGAAGINGSKWSPITYYTTGTVVFYNGLALSSLTTHTSSTEFTLDLDKWESVDNDAWLGQQNAHGITNLQAIYQNDSGLFQKAQANAEWTLATHLALHTNTNYILAVNSGDYEYVAHGLTGVQYCSDSVAGTTTHVQPDPSTAYINPVMVIPTINKIRVVVDQPAYYK